MFLLLILAIVDEFQLLFVSNVDVTHEASVVNSVLCYGAEVRGYALKKSVMGITFQRVGTLRFVSSNRTLSIRAVLC